MLRRSSASRPRLLAIPVPFEPSRPSLAAWAVIGGVLGPERTTGPGASRADLTGPLVDAREGAAELAVAPAVEGPEDEPVAGAPASLGTEVAAAAGVVTAAVVVVDEGGGGGAGFGPKDGQWSAGPLVRVVM